MASKLKVGDTVMMDAERCHVIGFGTKTDSVILRVTVPGKIGRRLAVAVVPREGLKKV